MSKFRQGIPHTGMADACKLRHPKKQNHEPLLDINEVITETGLHRTSISHKITDGTFPKPYIYSGRHGKAYWLKSDIAKIKRELKK